MGESFVVSPSYGAPLERMIAKGAYDDVSPYLNEKNFPLEKTGPARVRVEFVSFDFGEGLVNSLDAAKALEARGYRAATITELLAIGEQYSSQREEMTIIAAGTVYVVPGAGHKAVAALRIFKTQSGVFVRQVEVYGAGVTGFRETNVLFAAVKK